MQRLCALTSSHPFRIQIGTLVMVLMLGVRVSMTLRSRHETLALVLRSPDAAFDHVAREARLALRVLRDKRVTSSTELAVLDGAGLVLA
jgi:hypothetical protein